MDTFRAVLKATDVLNEEGRIVAKTNQYARKGNPISNPEGYLINALKKTIKDHEERSQQGEPGEAVTPGTPAQGPATPNAMNVIEGLANKKNINN